MIVFEDSGTCPCGHEVEPESGDCIVWTPDSWPHFVPQNADECRCCGYGLRLIETTFQTKLERMR